MSTIEQSQSTEEIFLATKEVFRKQASEAMEEALDKIYTDYLPHVESDTQSNVYFQACDWIRRFISDSLREDDFKIDGLNHSCYDVRKKMFQDNKEELTKVIGEDIINRIKDLESRHSFHWEKSYV